MPFSAWSSSAQARWLCSVSIARPSSTSISIGRRPRRLMPVSIITSQARPGAICFQRATCSIVLRHGPSLNVQRRLAIVGPDAVKNDQAGALRKLSERFRLGPGGYEEVPATRFEQRFHGLARAEAVAVGLDRRARGHSRTLLEPAPVGLERGAVDGQAQRIDAWPRRNGATRARRDSPSRLSQFRPSNARSTSSTGSSRQWALTLHASGCERG